MCIQVSRSFSTGLKGVPQSNNKNKKYNNNRIAICLTKRESSETGILWIPNPNKNSVGVSPARKGIALWLQPARVELRIPQSSSLSPFPLIYLPVASAPRKPLDFNPFSLSPPLLTDPALHISPSLSSQPWPTQSFHSHTFHMHQKYLINK